MKARPEEKTHARRGRAQDLSQVPGLLGGLRQRSKGGWEPLLGRTPAPHGERGDQKGLLLGPGHLCCRSALRAGLPVGSSSHPELWPGARWYWASGAVDVDLVGLLGWPGLPCSLAICGLVRGSSMRSPATSWCSHRSPFLSQTRPTLQSEFTASLVAPARSLLSLWGSSGPGCVYPWMLGREHLWSAVRGEGSWEPTLSSHAAPANVGRPSEVKRAPSTLVAQMIPGPCQSCEAGEFCS